MDKNIRFIHQELSNGTCCSQALVKLGLKLTGREDPLLEAVSSSFCLGVRGGLTCGALTGAAILLSLYDPELANTEMIPELTEWFVKETKDDGLSPNCRDILQGDMSNRVLRCPELIIKTWEKTREILEDQGFEIIEPEEDQ